MVSVRFNDDTISIWTRSAETEACEQVRETMKRITGGLNPEFKRHDESLRGVLHGGQPQQPQAQAQGQGQGSAASGPSSSAAAQQAPAQ